MNKRQIKKFCKKGGYYHFDKTIRKMSHKGLMHPYVARDNLFNYQITWHEIGASCMTCEHCTDVIVDWNGEPYACYSTTIGCGGCEKFACKRYKLDKDLKFFKFMRIHSDSPESDLKRYIDEQIERYTNESVEKEQTGLEDYLDRMYAGAQKEGGSYQSMKGC